MRKIFHLEIKSENSQLPDYIHDDTLIVVDPEKLNVEIDSCDGSDGDISEALYRNCKKYFAK